MMMMTPDSDSGYGLLIRTEFPLGEVCTLRSSCFSLVASSDVMH